MKVSGIIIDDSAIKKMINETGKIENRLKESLRIISDIAAKKMADWGRINAKWTPRTGDAQKYLTGEAYWENNEILTVAVMHNINYGIWLELAHEKKFAILEQSIETQREELMKQYGKLL